MKNCFYLIVILASSMCFSQATEIVISGTIYLDSLATEAAVVTIKSKLKTTSSITASDGTFIFKSIPIEQEKTTVLITASYFGYATYEKTYDIKELKTLKVDIYLQTSAQKLDEVIITSDAASIKKEINKLSYKVNKKNFIKNSKATTVLNDVPSLSYSESQGVKIDGRRSAKVFIDGIEAVGQELKALDVSEMEKVEVTYTPSARYGSEFTGGIINITTKVKDQLYYKGYLELGKGLLLNKTTYSPQLTFKTKKFIFKGFFYGLQNEQEVNFDLKRNATADEQSYTQNSFRKPESTYGSGNVKIRYFPSKNDAFFLNGSYVLNDIEGGINGTFSRGFDDPVLFSNNTGNSYEQYIVDGIYERKIKNNLLYAKARYWTYNKNEFFEIENNGVFESALDTESKIDEFSGELTYEIPKAKIINKEINLVVGTKYINRKYSYRNNPFFLDQNIYSAFSDISFSLNKKLSLFSSLYLENTTTRNETVNRDIINFLPSTTVNYSLNKKENISISYSNRIKRPNAYDLNNNEILLNPGIIERGNDNLSFQKEDYYTIRYGKSLKNRGYFSITPYYQNIKDAILQSISQQNGFLVFSKDNIGSVNTYGLGLGYSTSFFKVIRSNINFGIKHSDFENQGDFNSGTSFYGNISLSTNILKDRLSLRFFGSTDNPSYNFVSRTTKLPYTSLIASTNLFKDKVSVSLNYTDLFRLSSKIRTTIDTDAVFQLTRLNSNASNITLSLTYNFGKSFNDRFRIKSIENNDINN